MGSRELTRTERAAIRKMVTGMCANYDYEYGCLPLDRECFMLHKWWSGAYCRYFQNAVLPIDPVLEAMLLDETAVETRLCAFCGEPFPANGKQAYCGTDCAGHAQRRRNRDYMRKKRLEGG